MLVAWSWFNRPQVTKFDKPSQGGQMGRTDFLFAKPGFLTGAGRTLDLAAVLEQYSYNFSATPREADAWATANDWAVVGQDLRRAIEPTKVESAKR